MKNIASLLTVVLAAASAAAAPSGDARFARSLSVPLSSLAAAAAQAKSPAAAAPGAPASCEPAKELEVPFELTVPGAAAPLALTYAGCAEFGRNDYLAGYTERSYKGAGGYALTLVTGHDDGAYPSATPDESEVLVSKGGTWVARLGTIANAALVSGAPEGRAGWTVRADDPALDACRAALPKAVYGPNELWLLTAKTAYFYRQDCDICAELDACDLASGAVKAEITAHAVSCPDLAAYRKGTAVLYDRCAP
ncbi:MAG: hypothetical protein KGM24_02660 [Elusimicrobia bacterium]|nr:hypothetical protein [Elusimicrobiota bacterium]